MRRWLMSGLLGGSVAAAAYWRRALTLDGALGAAVVGCVVFARGGWPAAGALLAFFTSSSALSKVGQARKHRTALGQAKGGRRDLLQVLANGGAAALCIGIWGRRGGANAFVCALACAGADTWATELGSLASGRPRLITTLESVEAGTSGGVTPQGLVASVAGALTVGLAWELLGGGRPGAVAALLAGTWGSLIDSVLGATLQAAYRCESCDVMTEHPIHRVCGQPARLIRGWRWMTNDTVNALSTLASAGLGAASFTRLSEHAA